MRTRLNVLTGDAVFTSAPRRHMVLAIAVAAASTFMASGCVSAKPQAAAPAPVTVTATPPQLAAPAPVTVTATPAPATTNNQPDTTRPKPATKPTAEAEPVTFKMPYVVGMVLQDAQDLLQTKGSYLMDQQDATGLERLQVLDANWMVCSQKPNKGATVADDDVVTLSSVKLSEDCP